MADTDSIAGPLTGRCLCGSVTLEACDVSSHYHVCHCDMCRRWNGGSNLYYRFKQSDDWYLWAGLFDDQSAFTIAQEIYIDRKPPGYAFAGAHPRLTEDEFLRSIGLK